MLYIGMSAFTANSAAFVYNKAGALHLFVTDDMVHCTLPPWFPWWIYFHDIKLIYNLSHSVTTDPTKLSHPTQHQDIWSLHPAGDNSFYWSNKRLDLPWQFVSYILVYFQIAKRFPGLMMKLLVQTVKPPVTTFEPNNLTVQASSTVTAYAIQPNTTLSPLFVLNLVGNTADMMKSHCVWEKHWDLYIVFSGNQCQRPSVCPRNEAGWSCHPQQVSYKKKSGLVLRGEKWSQKVPVKMNITV